MRRLRDGDSNILIEYDADADVSRHSNYLNA